MTSEMLGQLLTSGLFARARFLVSGILKQRQSGPALTSKMSCYVR